MKIYQFNPSEKAERLKRLQKEIKIVEGLNIEEIPKTYGLVPEATWIKSDGKTCQVSYIIMDFVDGVDLLDFLNQSKKQEDPVVRYIFLKLGRILNLLHKAGIAHRDLKHENVMITKNLKLRVIDLGYAQKLDGTNGKGFSETSFGTHMYMAPEIE